MNSIETFSNQYRESTHQKSLDSYIKSKFRTFNTTKTLFKSLFQTPVNDSKVIQQAIYLTEIVNTHTTALIERVNYELKNDLTGMQSSLDYVQEKVTNNMINDLSNNLVPQIRYYDLMTLEKVKTIFNTVINKFSRLSKYLPETIILDSILNDEDEDTVYEKISSIQYDQISSTFRVKSIYLLIQKNYIASAIKLIHSNYLDIKQTIELFQSPNTLKNINQLSGFFSALLKTFPNSLSLLVTLINAYLFHEKNKEAIDLVSQGISILLNSPSDIMLLDPTVTQAILFILENVEDSIKTQLASSFLSDLNINLTKNLLKAMQASLKSKKLLEENPAIFEKFILKDLQAPKKTANAKHFDIIRNLEIIGIFNSINYSDETTKTIKRKLNGVLKTFRSPIHKNIEHRISHYTYLSNLVITNDNFNTKKFNPIKLTEKVQINEVPIAVKAIELQLFKEALILIQNGAITDILKSENSTILHTLANSTEKNHFWSNKKRDHFFKLFDLLIEKGYRINQKNDDHLSPIALVNDVDTAMILLSKYGQELNHHDLINQCLMSQNTHLAVRLYDGKEITISKDERILSSACFALNKSQYYTNEKLLLKLVKTVFEQISSIEISEGTNHVILGYITEHFRNNSLTIDTTPRHLYETYVPSFKLKPIKDVFSFMMRYTSTNNINAFVKLLTQIDGMSPMASTVLAEALRVVLSTKDDHALNTLISIIKSYKNLDFPRFFYSIVKASENDFSIDSLHKYYPILKKINPNFLNTYLEDKHILFDLLKPNNNTSRFFSTDNVYEIIYYLVDKYDFDINSIFDTKTGETIFSTFVRRFASNTEHCKNLYNKCNPPLNKEFNNGTTIFHLIAEDILKATISDEHSELLKPLKSIFNFFTEKYPDWIYLIGKTTNPISGRVITTSPALFRYIRTDTNCIQKLFYQQGSEDFYKHLAADFIQEVQPTYKESTNPDTSIKCIINMIIDSANLKELFLPDSSNHSLFYHTCRYYPLNLLDPLVIEMNKSIINTPNSDGVTPFQIAIKYNNYHSVTLLLKHGGDPCVALEGNRNIAHYQWEKISCLRLGFLHRYIPNDTQGDKNKILELMAKLELQIDKELELPMQKTYILRAYTHFVVLYLNKLFIDNRVKTNNIHLVLTDLWPSLVFKDNHLQHETKLLLFIKVLIQLGLLNYVPSLIDDYTQLSKITDSVELKLMLCYKPKTFEFNALKELEPIQFKDPVNIFKNKFDGTTKSSQKFEGAKNIILKKIKEIDCLLNDSAKISDNEKLEISTLKYCIINILLSINNKAPANVLTQLKLLANACKLSFEESLNECKKLLETLVEKTEPSEDNKDAQILNRLKSFAKNKRITASPSDDNQRLFEYQKIMLIILSTLDFLEEKDEATKSQQIDILNNACGLCLTGMVGNCYQIYQSLTGTQLLLSTRESFIRVLENFRSGIFDQFASQHNGNNQSTHTINHLVQRYGDELGVSKRRSNQGDPYYDLSEEVFDSFLSAFRIKHQINRLVYIIQQQFIELYADNHDNTIDYIKSIAPEGSNEFDFLSKAILFDSKTTRLSVYGALTILVDLGMYEISEKASSLVEELTSLEDSDDEDLTLPDTSILPQKRPLSKPSEDEEMPKKKQKKE